MGGRPQWAASYTSRFRFDQLFYAATAVDLLLSAVRFFGIKNYWQSLVEEVVSDDCTVVDYQWWQ